MRVRAVLLSTLVLIGAGCGQKAPREYQGYVEAENIYLASPYGGILESLDKVRGSSVQRGEAVFRLDSNPEEILVREREAVLEQARRNLLDLQKPRRIPEVEAIEAQIARVDADLQLARLRVKRQEELYARKATDKDSVDAAIARQSQQEHLRSVYEANLRLARLGAREEQVNAARAEVVRASESLEDMRWILAQKRVKAPADGMIFDTYFRPGEYVGAQQPVASLLAPQNIYVEFFVPVEELPNLMPGKKITFDCAGCANASQAVVDYVSPEAEFVPPLVYSRENYEKLVFRIKARPEHPAQFRPGQPVTVLVP